MICSILIEGLIYGIMVLGVFSTFRILNFCDMTVDGSFPMGACVLAVCLSNGIALPFALLLAFFAGILAGLVTTLIYTSFKIPDLLAGILTMTMLYSVNLRICSNKANISLLKVPNFFSKLSDFCYDHFPTVDSNLAILLFLFIFVFALKGLMDLFYHTDLGLTMGALGANPQLIISQGINPNIVRGIGICAGNGLAALAGAFAAMYNGFSDVGMGTGVVVSGLASLMLGEFLLKSNKISLQTARVLLGSIIYRALMVLARTYGYKIHMTPNDLKLATGILIILCLLLSKTNFLSNFKKKNNAQKEGTK